jgi:peptide-methionine (S)-S-oxide reductase
MRTFIPILFMLAGAALIFVAFNSRHPAQAVGDILPPSSPPATIPANAQQATFAAGCFWGVEENFRHVKGVLATTVGFSGGFTQNPTYADVCTDLTGHAESVLVTYDPAQVSYAELLDAFWTCHDPTTKNRQGPDVGTQYRSIIFFHNPEQEKLARESLKEVEAGHFFKSKIVTEIIPAAPFYKAEEYHQQYLAKNGGVCHVGPTTVTTKLAKDAAADRAAQAATQPH